jgi:Protein of unknown function (DUF1360)
VNTIDFAVRGLATYRLTRLITRDEITAPLRDKVWESRPPESSLVGYFLTCEWCASIWAGSALQISRMIAPKTTSAVETVLAVSAIAGLLTAHEDR